MRVEYALALLVVAVNALAILYWKNFVWMRRTRSRNSAR